MSNTDTDTDTFSVTPPSPASHLFYFILFLKKKSALPPITFLLFTLLAFQPSFAVILPRHISAISPLTDMIMSLAHLLLPTLGFEAIYNKFKHTFQDCKLIHMRLDDMHQKDNHFAHMSHSIFCGTPGLDIFGVVNQF